MKYKSFKPRRRFRAQSNSASDRSKPPGCGSRCKLSFFLYSGTPEGAGLTLEVISISKSAQQEDKVELFLCHESSEDPTYQGTFQVPPLLTGCQKNENYDESKMNVLLHIGEPGIFTFY